MDPTNKKQGASPHYSLYQREVFKRGGEHGQRAHYPLLVHARTDDSLQCHHSRCTRTS